MATLQRFILPPRSLTKYKYLPSGDQMGFASTAESFVTAVGVPPPAAIVKISRILVLETAQYAIRNPCGDHEGCTASVCVRSRFSAFPIFTIQSPPDPLRK